MAAARRAAERWKWTLCIFSPWAFEQGRPVRAWQAGQAVWYSRRIFKVFSSASIVNQQRRCVKRKTRKGALLPGFWLVRWASAAALAGGAELAAFGTGRDDSRLALEGFAHGGESCPGAE